MKKSFNSDYIILAVILITSLSTLAAIVLPVVNEYKERYMTDIDTILKTQHVNKQVKIWEEERTKIIKEYDDKKAIAPTFFCRKTVGKISGLTFKITNIKKKLNDKLSILNGDVKEKHNKTMEIRNKLGLE